MRIALLSAFPIFEGSVGGAELSDYAMMREGFQRGHTIVQVAPQAVRPEEHDVSIVANFRTAMGHPVWPHSAMLEATQRVPTVFYVHDVPYCHHQLHYPMQPKCLACPNGDKTRTLLESAALCVFLSPLHVERLAKSQPWIEQLPRHLTPSPIDVEHYRDRQSLRVPGTVLGVNALLQFKGAANVLEYVKEHPELQFTFVGGTHIEPSELPRHAVYLGGRLPSQMPDLYSQSEAYIALPSTLDPFSRSIAEARLCGVKRFVRNENIGACSYPQWGLKDEAEFVEWIAEAPVRFWEAIEKEVGV